MVVGSGGGRGNNDNSKGGGGGVKTKVLAVVTVVTVEMDMTEVMVLEVVVGAGCGGENWPLLGARVKAGGCHGAVGSGRGCVGLLIQMLSTAWLPFKRTIPISDNVSLPFRDISP